MVLLYHGSDALFTRPDISKIPPTKGMGVNEYGWGFYTSDYAGDSWEYLDQTKPGIIYTMDLPDEIFKTRWLKAHEPVSRELLERVATRLTEAGYEKTAARIRDTQGQIRGYDLYSSFELKTPKQTSEFWVSCGIDGYLEGAYHVFFNMDSVPEFSGIHSAYRYPKGRDANADLQYLKNAEKSATNKSQFTQFRSVNFMSDDAQRGYETLRDKTGNPELCTLYVEMIELTKHDKNWGFNMRQSLGCAVYRAYLPPHNDDAYFGSTVMNLPVSYNHMIREEKMAALFDAFKNKLLVDPRVYFYTQNAPKRGAGQNNTAKPA